MSIGDITAIVTAATALVVAVGHLVADLRGRRKATPVK